jgi:hypothetical protein
MEELPMSFRKIVLAVCILGLCAFAPANAYTLSTTVTTDGVQSTDGGHLEIGCRQAGTLAYSSCGSSIAAGTQVRIDAVIHVGYWFMWFMTNPYLSGCTTTNWGWGYGSNWATVCTFTMPSGNASVNAEFQLP